MVEVAGAFMNKPMHTDPLQDEEYKTSLGGAPFDPTEVIALIRALAYNSMHGDSEACQALNDEISRLHRTPFEAVVALELAKPDKTKKLPVATVALDAYGRGISTFFFHAGSLDFSTNTEMVIVKVV
jgi:hypothetical protein